MLYYYTEYDDRWNSVAARTPGGGIYPRMGCKCWTSYGIQRKTITVEISCFDCCPTLEENRHGMRRVYRRGI